MPPHVLVIGGTGILAPAVGTLAKRGAVVSVVSRSAARVAALRDDVASAGGTRVNGVIADVTQPRALAAALDGAAEVFGPIGLALAYQPSAPAGSWDALVPRVTELLVTVLVSAYAAEDAPPHPLRDGRHGRLLVRHLLLGWHRDDCGVRWHTPGEVSVAAVGVADRRASAVLGAVRPWAERPGA
ncbi:SDR family NAD(P)-dependent oxidoreductase [Nonomuraea sp. SBT364]|uniref:SDR family NAD(P)-dependent oxidoreductase n=1 Tax=Nonomuraea sp. SBT364 TaxID=1580530 RepID=UPI00066B8455|nr:SDR family NAD(P)-dependent oxidoreductase [Nonomuraea sp. SBT364]